MGWLKKWVPFRIKEKLKFRPFYPFFIQRIIQSKAASFSKAAGFAPGIVNIETTNACNAACVTCPHKELTRKIGFMDMRLFKQLIDECSRLGTRQVLLHHYGEPLLDETIAEKIAYAKSKKIKKLGFFTNASLLTARKSLELIASGLDEIYISFDGAVKDSFEKVRRGLSYEQVTSNIENLLKLRSHHPKIYLYFVSCPQNKGEAGLLKQQWAKQVDAINIGVYRKREYLAKVDRAYFAPCPYLWQEMFILWNGAVVPCCEDYDARSILGNAGSAGICQTWNASGFQQIRQQHFLSRSNNIALCNSCDLNLWWRWF